ncbi:MAG: FAD-binding oxidoreductase [Candidatus Schekmanbacteria bacterium]|nr:MAG: FAD-binding oxidoreductase [Candidatus Schekmanbacteria bacterium]
MFDELKKIVGEENAAFDENERRRYASDMASIPKIFRNLSTSLPDAVVRPDSTDEVSAILSFARNHKIPVIPRGTASSALGGVLPTKGGIILDMTRMKKILSIDEGNCTAKVEAGIVWENLDKALSRYGLAVKSYPTSAPSSTVAGWISTGGYGVGSLKYGHISEQIQTLTVVMSDGEIKNLTSDDKELFSALIGTEGQFAVITEIVLKLRKIPKDIDTYLFEFSDDDSALKFVKDVSSLKEKPFFVKYENSKAINAARDENAEKMGPSVIVRLEDEDIEKLSSSIKESAQKYNAKEKEKREALHHWDERFYPMRAKKKGPSMLAAEFLIPLSTLSETLNEIGKFFASKKIDALMEVHLISSNTALVMATYLTDERKKDEYLSHLFLIDSVMKIAFKKGGKPYGTGIWNAVYLNKRYSNDEINKLKNLKKEVDSEEILNPGKFFEFRTRFGPVLPLFHSIGMAGGGKLASLGLKLFGSKLEGTPEGEADEGIKRIEKEFDELWTCAKCGFCVMVCPTYEEIGWEGLTARGKINALKEALTGEYTDIPEELVLRAYQCTTCGACREVCQTDIETIEIWEMMRRAFVEKNKGPLPEHENLLKSIKNYDNPLQQPRSGRDRWARMALKEKRIKDKIQDIVKSKSKVLYHVGCIGSFDANVKEVAYNTSFILQSAGVDFGILGKKELCCASTLKRVGDSEFEKVASKTLELYNSIGVETVVTSCSGCYKTFKDDYPLLGEVKFKPVHIVEFLEKLINEGKLEFKKELDMTITYHDPCHLGRHRKIFEPPRRVLNAIPGVKLVEMERNRENSRCCGAGGGFRIAFPDVQARIAVKRVKDAEETGADYIVSGCPFCYAGIQTAISSTGSKLKMMDLTEIVAMALKEEE